MPGGEDTASGPAALGLDDAFRRTWEDRLASFLMARALRVGRRPSHRLEVSCPPEVAARLLPLRLPLLLSPRARGRGWSFGPLSGAAFAWPSNASALTGGVADATPRP